MASLTPAALGSDALLGIDLLVNNVNRDQVGVYDQTTFQQLFSDARPVRANVRESSKVMDHPVETGVTLSDHHVIEPKNIDISMIIGSEFYSSTYEQIRGAFVNATLLSVQTKAGVYPNMIIREMPHEEDPDMFNVIPIALKLREVLFIAPSSITQIQSGSSGSTTPDNYAPADPVNNNTVNRGLQAPVPLTAAQTQSIQTVLNTPAPQQ